MSWWRREPFVWSPWMSPAEVDAVNGLPPLGGPPEVPPAQVRAPCGLHDEGSYGEGWTCLRCQQAAAREAEPELDGLALGLLDDHELGEHEDGDHWLCRACQIREATVIDAGQGLFV